MSAEIVLDGRKPGAAIATGNNILWHLRELLPATLQWLGREASWSWPCRYRMADPTLSCLLFLQRKAHEWRINGVMHPADAVAAPNSQPLGPVSRCAGGRRERKGLAHRLHLAARRGVSSHSAAHQVERMPTSNFVVACPWKRRRII